MKTRSLLVWLLLFITSAVAAQELAERKPADSLDGPPFVTAKAWAIADARTGELLWGHNESAARPMASTTKIMTAWLVLRLAEQNPALLQEVVTISERSDKTGGSTADVRAGEQIVAADLLYGLLLPSGNDAAVALGEHFGKHFRPQDAQDEATSEQALEWFVAEMNRTAEELGMTETKYLDPHGNSANRSSARNLLRLAHKVMQNETFRSYVNTRKHTCQIVTPDGSQREASWTNTNQLLEVEGYDGVKTGTTGAAGACLVSSGHRGDDHLYVVVLGATSGDARYTDSRNLYRWAWLQRQSAAAGK